jgi:hypothetical protein
MACGIAGAGFHYRSCWRGVHNDLRRRSGVSDNTHGFDNLGLSPNNMCPFYAVVSTTRLSLVFLVGPKYTFYRSR